MIKFEGNGLKYELIEKRNELIPVYDELLWRQLRLPKYLLELYHYLNK